MKLLVSVADADEAAAACAGGADVIDAKDPAAAGALGPVQLSVLRGIAATVAGGRLLTAALGDVIDRESAEHEARLYASAGAKLVKIGFAGVDDRAHIRSLLEAARRGAEPEAGIVAVAYADAGSVGSADPSIVLDAAIAAGVTGFLIDTASKNGPGLRELCRPAQIAAWVEAAHRRGLLVALAGRLTIDDLRFARDAGADIAGVRGAACDGGRAGRVVVERVRQLKTAVRRSTPALAPAPAATCE
jgi:(5-formylfuran-3-yl)methyl phosphate synthase